VAVAFSVFFVSSVQDLCSMWNC